MSRANTHRLLLAAAVTVGLLTSGCDTPSSQIDGGELHNVFGRAARGDAGTGAPPRKVKKLSKDAGVPAIPERHRKPVAGPCVAPSKSLSVHPAKVERRPARRPVCRGARILEWRDRDGAPRYGCVWGPRAASERQPLPLVLFFHSATQSPRSVTRKTRLKRRLSKTDMTGLPAHQGFVVLAPQGRRIDGGLRFDTQFASEDNVDVKTVSHFVDVLLKEGLVDRRRVYTMGDAAGGKMAWLYAMLRPDLVAAVATFATDAREFGWSCPGPPPPGVALYRACDGVTPCDVVEDWLQQRRESGAATWALRLGAANAEEPHCAFRNRCGPKTASANHHRWPRKREPEILEFLARYTLEGAEP